MRLPESPKVEINYGIISPECEKAFKSWIRQVIKKYALSEVHPGKHGGFEDEVVNELYDELTYLGFREGQEDILNAME